MPMAIATPPQRMGPGMEEHELIGVVEAHPAVLRWLARAFEELVGLGRCRRPPIVGARVDFRVDELLRYGDAVVLPA
jgi:hypothetical protein